ncbi:MAG: PD-(D/E)XK nuclease family protein, partial [Alphaproteobacteria bacterium]|nr:PD-(D/E)XK nuclease family protein [Alphaproteobacteria bacterium]
DDSGGTPLALTPTGAFLNLVLAAASPYASVSDLLALLKHPLASCGLSTAACRTQAREAELRARRMEDEKFVGLRKLLQPLTQEWRHPLPLARRLSAHIAVAEDVSASDAESGKDRLWRGENGEAAAAWLDEWQSGAGGLPDLAGGDYAALFGSLAGTQILRSQHTTHPRLSILGPLEARLLSADLIILGGMNEASWPPDAGFDPWMSRPMRKDFGLPAPEFRIGLSAHDFAQLASAGEVMLTRSARANGSPTVPSRFLLQIDAVLRAAGLSETKDALEPAEPWRAWAQALDEPAQPPAPCPRPRPCPPVAARPTSLSVTEIGTWLRNPYAIYAKHILKLTKLEELDAELDAADRGTMIHAALEKFATLYPNDPPPDAEQKLLAIGRAIFAQDHGDPRVQAFWWARFTGIATWFIDQTRQRRAAGIMQIQAEAKGRTTLGAFTLRGRADRIDRLADGSLALIDYKTGTTPSKANVESGIEPQLPLLALIAERGGFAGLDAASIGTLEYWQLKGGRGDDKIIDIVEDIPALIKAAETGVLNLASAFAQPAQAYEVAPRARFTPKYDDYAHLARSAEWGREGEEE